MLAPPGIEHSADATNGQTTTGGIVSTTVTITWDVALAPCESVTWSVRRCWPRASVTLRRGPRPRSIWEGPPKFSNHSNFSMSSFVPGVESGSEEAEPSRLALAPDGEVHSTLVSAVATATGGLL